MKAVMLFVVERDSWDISMRFGTLRTISGRNFSGVSTYGSDITMEP